MSNPKFFPSEVVILQSVDRPQRNGEYTVLDVVPPNTEFKCRISGKILIRKESPQLAYRLAELIEVGENGVESCWLETALRKKHIPGEMPFTELMTKLTIKKVYERCKTVTISMQKQSSK